MRSILQMLTKRKLLIVVLVLPTLSISFISLLASERHKLIKETINLTRVVASWDNSLLLGRDDDEHRSKAKSDSPFNPIPSFIGMTEHSIVQSVPGLDMYIHQAYVDDRFNKTTLRIFGIERSRTTVKKWKCKWTVRDEAGFDVMKESSARLYYVYPQWPTDSIYETCNFDCHIDRGVVGVQIPNHVQLVSEVGHVFNVPVTKTTRIHPKRDLAVCVKPVTGQWDVYRLIEWFEIQRLTGIQHFIVYQTDLTGYARFVLEYYQRIGAVTVVSFPYLSVVLDKFRRRYKLDWKAEYYITQKSYLVAIHDCLYRFHGSYSFMQFMDLDEFILPTKNEDYPEMIKTLLRENPKAAGFHFLTSWHYEESGKIAGMGIPDYLYSQQYPISTRPKLQQPKSVIVAERVITTSYHMVQDVPNSMFKKVSVSAKRGYLHHYRGKCGKKFQKDRCRKELLETRLDDVVVRYQDHLEDGVRAVMDHLQIYYDDGSSQKAKVVQTDLVHPNAVII